jgi:hypothetical protein
MHARACAAPSARSARMDAPDAGSACMQKHRRSEGLTAVGHRSDALRSGPAIRRRDWRPGNRARQRGAYPPRNSPRLRQRRHAAVHREATFPPAPSRHDYRHGGPGARRQSPPPADPQGPAEGAIDHAMSLREACFLCLFPSGPVRQVDPACGRRRLSPLSGCGKPTRVQTATQAAKAATAPLRLHKDISPPILC